MYDLNDAEPQRGGVIEPCYAKIIGTLRPGGAHGPAPADHGLLKPSKQTGSDVLMQASRVHHRRGPECPPQVLADHDRQRRRGRREGPSPRA